MELVLDSLDHYIGADEESGLDWLVSDRYVEEQYRSRVPVVVPTFKAGDVLAFDHWLLHRSSRLPQQTATRCAIESWMFAPSAFPAGRKTVIA